MTIAPPDGTGCLLFRMPGSDLTYVEMVHPADFQHDELSWDASGGDTLRIAHRLFRTESGERRDPSRPGAGRFFGPARRRGGRGAVLRRLCHGRSAVGDVNNRDVGSAVHCHRNERPEIEHDRRLHYRKLSAAKRPRGGTVSSLRPRPADHRLPLPSSAGRGGRGSTLRELDADLAGGRSLQVAGDAGGRRAGAVLHGRRLGSGKVPEVGGDGAPNAPQSAVPLDAPGTEAAAWASATGCWAPTRPRAFGASATRNCSRPSSPPAASCGRWASCWSARPTIRPIRSRITGPSRPTRRFRSGCCPRFAPIGRWPWNRPRRSTPGWTGWPSRAASTSATISTAIATPCGSGTTTSTRSAAGFPITGSTRSMRPTIRRAKWRPHGGACEAANRWTRARSLKFKSAMLYELAAMNAEKGWVQQFHFGAMRSNNTRMLAAARAGYGLRLDRRSGGCPADGAVLRPARPRRPAGQNDRL